MVWLLNVVGFLFHFLSKHKAYAGIGGAGSAVGIAIFTASAAYSDKADQLQDEKRQALWESHLKADGERWDLIKMSLGEIKADVREDRRLGRETNQRVDFFYQKALEAYGPQPKRK
jgi:hypothetical protein